MSATTAAGAARAFQPKDVAASRALGRRRRLTDQLVRVFCIIATVIGLFFLGSIMVTLVWRGIGTLDWITVSREFQPTTYGDPDAPRGGLLHAILGTLVQSGMGIVIGTPIGILVGTYLSEYARGSRFGDAESSTSETKRTALPS